MDSGALARVLDDVLGYGGDYTIDRLDVGKTQTDESYARIRIEAADDEALQRLLMRVQTHGANQLDPGEALLREVDRDGVFPEDFYSTTNLETMVRLDGHWLPVANPEMDCGIVDRRRPAAHAPGVRRQGGRPGRLRRRRRTGRPAGPRPVRRRHLRVHGQRGLEREAAGPARPAGRPADARRARGRSEDPLGRRSWRRPHRCRPRHGRAGRARLRRRALRRQRPGHPRHRVVAVRHLARRRPGPRPRRRARPRAPHPGHQHDPPLGLDRRGRRVGRAHRRHHARDGPRRPPVRAGRVGTRRRAAARTSTPT